MKIISIPVLLLSFMLLSSSNTWGNPQAFSVYEQGISFERTLNTFRALDNFREAIALDPDNKGYLEHYAWLLHNHEFREEAVEAFQKLLQRDADKRVIYLGLGWDEKNLGRADRSIDYYGKVYDLAAPHSDVGKVFAEIQDRSYRENELKISELKQKLSKNPEDAEIEKELYQTYLYQSDWKNASSTGEHLLATSHADLQFRFVYYKGLLWAGRTAEAEAHISSLMVDSPDNGYLYYELGKLQNSMNRLKEAQASLEKSLLLYPGAMKTRKELCEVLARQGKTEDAVSMASSMNRDNDGRLEARLTLARVYHFSGRLDEAVPLYKHILADYPYNVEALWGLAETAYFSGDITAAQKVVATWQTFDSNNSRLNRIREGVDNALSPSLSLLSDFYANSSHFRRFNSGISVKYPLGAGISPRLGYYYSLFLQRDFSNINRHTLFLEGEKRISSFLSVDARLDMNIYDNDQNHLNGKITLHSDPFKGSHVALSYGHMDIIDTEQVFGNPMYNYVVTIGSVGGKISTDDFSIFLQQKIGNDLTLWGKLTYGSYSDKNDKLTYVLEADYRLTDIPFLQLIYSYFYLDYRKPAPSYQEGSSQVAAYYDPRNFEVHTIGIEYKQSLTPAFSFEVRESVSYIPKSSGFADSISAAAIFGITTADTLRLDLRYFYQNAGVDRNTTSGHFSAEHLMLSYNHRF